MVPIAQKSFTAHPDLASWSWEVAADSVVWSAAVYQFFGLPLWADAPAWSGQKHLYTPGSFETLQAALSLCVKSGESFVLRLDGIHSSGRPIYLDLYGYAERNASGRVVALSGQFIDRTEREKTKQALQISNDHFSLSFEHAVIGKAIVSPQGKLLKVNPSLAKTLGYSREELEGLTFQQITFPEDLEQDLHHVTELLAGKITEYSMEKRYLHKSGGIIWARLSVALARKPDGEPLYFISQIQDITQSRHSSDLLRFCTMAMKEISQAVLISDASRKLIWMNQAFSFMTGYSEEETLGKDCKFLQGPQSDPETVKRISFAMRNAMDFHGEILNYRRNGSTFWNELSISPVYDDYGQLVNFIGVAQDITAKVDLRQMVGDKNHILTAILESSTTGYMVIDAKGVKLYQNQQFSDLYRIPPDIAEDPAWLRQLEWVADTVKEKEAFLSKIHFLDQHPEENGSDHVELKDGRLLERISIPVFKKDGKYFARLWSLREVTGKGGRAG